ncbi:MAG: inorganic pyrophosphatase Ppa [Desulfobacterales bacterium]|nr:inorganic pyrophosphatase Ppa [Desulfobacterales bacterium]
MNLQSWRKFEIQAYRPPRDRQALRKTHIPFGGSAFKQSQDSKKVILIPDPYSSHTFYYEFRVEDIAFAEELPSIVNSDEDIISMTRIWVKKGSMGLRCTPFRVEETSISPVSR